MPALTFSTEDNGSGVALISLGAGANGGIADATQTLFLRHDQTLPITGVGFYISTFVGGYTGAATAAADLAEILDWGGAAGDNYGGVQINQNAIGTFPDTSWPTTGSPVRGNGETFMRTRGDTSATPIPLHPASRAVGGAIPSGVTNVSVRFRVQIPTSETTPGVRLYSLNVVYTFSS